MFNRRSEILLVISYFVAGAVGLVNMSAFDSFHPGLESWWALVIGIGGGAIGWIVFIVFISWWESR